MTKLEEAIKAIMERAWGKGDPEEMERMLLTIGVDPDEMRRLANAESAKALSRGIEEGWDILTIFTAHAVNMFLAGAEYHKRERTDEQKSA